MHFHSSIETAKTFCSQTLVAPHIKWIWIRCSRMQWRIWTRNNYNNTTNKNFVECSAFLAYNWTYLVGGLLIFFPFIFSLLLPFFFSYIYASPFYHCTYECVCLVNYMNLTLMGLYNHIFWPTESPFISNFWKKKIMMCSLCGASIWKQVRKMNKCNRMRLKL